MTEQEPLYRYVDGEAVISTAGMALLLGLSTRTRKILRVRAEMERQQARARGSFRMPEAWRKNGVRQRKRIAAELGYEPAMEEALEHLAGAR